MIDYHMHTKLCKHARGEAHEFIETAIAAGITEIAFTDHIPLPDGFDLQHRMAENEIELYIRWIESLQIRYPGIKIRLGIEADYIEGLEEYLFKFLNTYDFDVVIMAVHFLKHWPADQWVFAYDFPGKPIEAIYLDYLETVIRGIRTGLFDILGHADIIKNPAAPLLSVVPGGVYKLLSEIKSAGMAMEINTSGFRKPIGESFPALNWLGAAQRYGIPLTIGSDAHRPSQIALRFPEVYIRLEQFNINRLATFEKRQMKYYSLNRE